MDNDLLRLWAKKMDSLAELCDAFDDYTSALDEGLTDLDDDEGKNPTMDMIERHLGECEVKFIEAAMAYGEAAVVSKAGGGHA